MKEVIENGVLLHFTFKENATKSEPGSRNWLALKRVLIDKMLAARVIPLDCEVTSESTKLPFSLSLPPHKRRSAHNSTFNHQNQFTIFCLDLEFD